MFDEEMSDLFSDEEVKEETPVEVEDPKPEEPKETKEEPSKEVKNEVQLAKDFAELHDQYPDISMEDIRDKERYMLLRNNGCTAREAYLATAERRAPSAGTKSHLHSVASTPAGAGASITRGEIEAYKELLNDPKLTDKDIVNLIRRAKN